MDDDDDENASQVFHLDESDLPLVLAVFDKDGNEVDRITITEPGAVPISAYPAEGTPYYVKVISKGHKPFLSAEDIEQFRFTGAEWQP